MLKHLAILAVLVLGCAYQAWPQSPRNGSKQDRPTQKETDSAKLAQPSAPALQVQLAPTKQEGNAQKEPSKYPWKELLAPANIPNWALCFVGGFAGWAAFKTLRAIKYQADLMKEQSDLMVEKERAKLRIELKPFRPVRSSDEFDSYMVEGIVSIYGTTEAFIESSQIYACIGYDGMLHPLPEWHFGLHLSPVIVTGTAPTDFRTMVIAKEGPASDQELLPVRQKNDTIFCVATIEFSDVFGQRWEWRLRQRFEFFWPDLSADASGLWVDDGPVESSGEYHRKDQSRRPKPT